jgi:hypothetical protein
MLTTRPPKQKYPLFITRYNKFRFNSLSDRYKTASLAYVLGESQMGSLAMYRNLSLLITAWQVRDVLRLSLLPFVHRTFDAFVSAFKRFASIHRPNYP